MAYPADRPRRLRRTDALRSLVRETDVLPRHLVQPLFVDETASETTPIDTMPGQFRYPPDAIAAAAGQCAELGVPAVILFGIPARKDARGSSAWSGTGVVQKAIRAIRESSPELVVMADLCLCEYTSHGQCGVLDNSGEVDNDATLACYAETALSYAEAGAHVVAPSGMMDGTVAALRHALEDRHRDVAILAYAVKYASAFYGPFRAAADSAPKEGDRRGYQMDPGNAREGLREAALDDAEGADILMVKPAGHYLDVVARVRAMTSKPVAAYQVSGEYSMIVASGERGLIDRRLAMWESVRSIRRAGADLVVTYFACDIAREHRERGTT